MSSKRRYGATDLTSQTSSSKLDEAAGQAVVVAIDVAKERMMAAFYVGGALLLRVRWSASEQLALFIAAVTGLMGKALSVTALMEPTGTYGNALRRGLQQVGAQIVMMDPWRVHQSRAMFDGVDSLHDGKSTEVMFRMHENGLGKPWQPPPEWQSELRTQVECYLTQQGREHAFKAALEALVSDWLPGTARWLSPWDHVSWLTVLSEQADPRQLLADREALWRRLQKLSSENLSREVFDGAVAALERVAWDRMGGGAARQIQMHAIDALAAYRAKLVFQREIEQRVAQLPLATHVAPWIGRLTTGVVLAYLGDLGGYASPGALEKAAGLNLIERSSGEKRGKPRLSKRGHAGVRQMLYMAALRWIKSDPVARAWYTRRTGIYRKPAVIALMRKMIRALWHLARGNAYDASKLFDTRLLDLTKPAVVTDAPEPVDAVPAKGKRLRTEPRAVSLRAKIEERARNRARKTTGGTATT